jgi:molecular chaperone Hsp33
MSEQRSGPQSVDNALTAFQFDSHIAHGAFVQIAIGAETLLDQRPYAPAVRKLIAETIAAMPLLATHLRTEGRINLQFQSSDPASPVKLLVAQVDHHLNARGMAKAAADTDGDFATLLSGGVLALLLEPLDDTQSTTQATVPVEGASLAESLEGYFAQSEQLPTLIRLAVRDNRLSGFLLQRLPIDAHTQATQDNWEHLSILAATLTEDELLDVPPETLLRRLFAEESLTVFAPRPVAVACRCSEFGIGRLLLSLGRPEVDSIVDEQGRVAITCEFCGREYVYLPADVQMLFAAAEQQPAATRH